MELRSVYKIIKKSLPTMNANHQKIGNYILSNLSSIEYLTLKQIAQASNSSEASVTRFCQKLGFTGFLELRRLLMEINKNLFLNRYELLMKKEFIQNVSVFYQEYLKQLETVQESIRKLIQTNEFKQAAILIGEAPKIVIAGMNINYNQTLDFKNKLNAIGKFCILEQDLHVLSSLANTIKKDEVFITISLSNTNQTVIKFGKIAKLNGAYWVHFFSQNQNNKLIDGILPDICLKFDSHENELWNLYSLRGEGLFQLLNLLFVESLEHQSLISK